MQISVIIVNWNRKELLNACLDSLVAQSFKNFEIIVVDNGSTDGSNEMIREKFRQVRLIELGKNTGFCYANNVGIKESKSKYIALLNNDTEVEADWLSELVETLDSNSKYSFASSKMICMNDKTKIR